MNEDTLCLFKKIIYLAVPGVSCGMRDLVPWMGIKPRPIALGAQGLSHWTKEVPTLCLNVGSFQELCEKSNMQHSVIHVLPLG